MLTTEITSPEKRAEPFIATRHHHHLEIAEDYVELIDDLIKSKAAARTCDIAARLGVSHVTVIRTLKRLELKGFLITKKHKPIMLTKKGQELAYHTRERHALLLEYLITIGVPKEIAVIDVEGMEHHISIQTLEAFKKHLEIIKKEKAACHQLV